MLLPEQEPNRTKGLEALLFLTQCTETSRLKDLICSTRYLPCFSTSKETVKEVMHPDIY